MEGPATVNHGWRTSSYSNGGAATCVEVGAAVTGVLVRDTTDNGQGLTLRVTPAAWSHFTIRIRANCVLG